MFEIAVAQIFIFSAPSRSVEEDLKKMIIVTLVTSSEYIKGLRQICSNKFKSEIDTVKIATE